MKVEMKVQPMMDPWKQPVLKREHTFDEIPFRFGYKHSIKRFRINGYDVVCTKSRPTGRAI